MDLLKESDLFEQWWDDEGQYHRAGGDDYCKTFAWEAWIFSKAQSEKALLEQFEINNKLVEQIEKLKARAVPEVINVGNELQSWVAVNSFSADDGDGVLPVVDANALAEKIEELTGANQ